MARRPRKQAATSVDKALDTSRLSEEQVAALVAATSDSLAVERLRLATSLNMTYNGLRDVSRSLGYETSLTPIQYRARYERGGIAERIVEALPNATWGDGVGIVENSDRSVTTPFESAIAKLVESTEMWQKLVRADILAGLGEYAVIVIGTKRGQLTDPLPRMTSPADIIYLTPVGQDKASIHSYDTSPSSPRFGLPDTYQITFGGPAPISTHTTIASSTTKIVHHSRVVHVAEGVLDSDVIGKPRLRACWNNLDDLVKLVGGGSEAAWRRMDPGMQLDLDPELEMDEEEEAAMSAEVDEYVHGLNRVMRTRGVKANILSASVSSFGANASAVIDLISATSTIPQRILMGSERGQLSSEQDRNNWSDRISERRKYFAEPLVRGLIDRLIDKGALPTPTSYQIEWSRRDTVPIKDKANAISAIALANENHRTATGEVIMTANEIRDMVLGLGPMRDQGEGADGDGNATGLPVSDDGPTVKGFDPTNTGAPKSIEPSPVAPTAPVTPADKG